MIALMNSPRLTSYGHYDYKQISLSEVKSLIESGFTSYIGHQSTAELISRILGVRVEQNRVMYYQLPGDQAIIFENQTRLNENDILDFYDLEKLDFRFALLTRLT